MTEPVYIVCDRACMKKIFRFAIKTIPLLILLAALIPSACSNSGNEIRVVVICNGSPFSGYFIEDANISYFTNDTLSGSVYSREITFTDLSSGDEIEFDVSTTDKAYSLSVIVYRDDKKVKSGSSTSSTASSPLYLHVTYKVGEEDSSSSSSS